MASKPRPAHRLPSRHPVLVTPARGGSWAGVTVPDNDPDTEGAETSGGHYVFVRCTDAQTAPGVKPGAVYLVLASFVSQRE